MKKHLTFITVFATTLMLAGAALAYLPNIQVLVLNASGSISEEDFLTQKLVTAKFIAIYHERAKLYPDLRSDWIAVTFFGGNTDFCGTLFVKCDDTNAVLKLIDSIIKFPHPKYGNTAIYTAITNALLLCAQKDEALPGRYMKNLIVVTDGQDNSSNPQLKAAVIKLFPNNEVNLFVVGVGREAQIKEFQHIADAILSVENFNDLLAALLTLGHMAH